MTTKKSVQAQQKVGAGIRIKSFFQGVIVELKKVHWPDKKQLVTYTGVVLVAVLLASFLIWIMDLVLGGVMSLFL